MNALAIALVIPAFPDNVRSDTYAVDYGRINGPEWMARSASWYAPAKIVTMTCCNTRYATVAETVNHRCPVEYVVVVETHTEDLAVVAVAADEAEAVELAWGWADRTGGSRWAKDVWVTGTLAEVEDSWGDQTSLPRVTAAGQE